MPRLHNLKVKELRKRGYRDLEDWASRPDHLYIGRRMRIFIYTEIKTSEAPTTKVGMDRQNRKMLIRPSNHKNKKQPYCEKLLQCPTGSYVSNHQKIVKLFVIPESKWHNPFRVSDGGLQSSLDRFKQYFANNTELQSSLHELDNIAFIGCWCHPKPCHGNVILEAYQRYKFQQKAKQKQNTSSSAVAQRSNYESKTESSTTTTTTAPMMSVWGDPLPPPTKPQPPPPMMSSGGRVPRPQSPPYAPVYGRGRSRGTMAPRGRGYPPMRGRGMPPPQARKPVPRKPNPNSYSAAATRNKHKECPKVWLPKK